MGLAEVTAADRAAATCQCWIRHKLKSERAEGVAGAIGKLPDGLRPPPHLRRGEIPSLPPSAEGGGSSASADGGGYAHPSHVRGGSVSRRGLTQAYRRPPALAWARKSEGTYKPIPSYSSGEGVWGRGASLREAASPPESPYRCLFEREREGGGFSSEKPPPSHPHFRLIVISAFWWGALRPSASVPAV